MERWRRLSQCWPNIQLYTFDETPVTPWTPIEVAKDNPDHIRIVAYNTLGNGLNSAGRVDNFEDIITQLSPDIIGFLKVATHQPLQSKTCWTPGFLLAQPTAGMS